MRCRLRIEVGPNAAVRLACVYRGERVRLQPDTIDDEFHIWEERLSRRMLRGIHTVLPPPEA